MQNKTIGIVGAGRIGTAYARMMAEGHKCNIMYHDPYQNKFLEGYMADYSKVQRPALAQGRRLGHYRGHPGQAVASMGINLP